MPAAPKAGELAAVFSVLSLIAGFQQISPIGQPIPLILHYKFAEFCAVALFMAAGAIHIRRRSLRLRGTPAR